MKSAKNQSLGYGIACLLGGLLGVGSGVLLYFLLIRGKELHPIDGVLLYAGAGIFALVGLYTVINGIATVFRSLRRLAKGEELTKDTTNVTINLSPAAGITALALSVLFGCLAGLVPWEGDRTGQIFFAAGAGLLFVYALSVLVYCLVKRKK